MAAGGSCSTPRASGPQAFSSSAGSRRPANAPGPPSAPPSIGTPPANMDTGPPPPPALSPWIRAGTC
ncbi:MAG: hypothetical protein DI623_10345 [Sphingomonas sanxanigenens]|uniref:Uncharacterized protein n=1 Tax=Sphingomonas sanxanigenens TaxID=397260 RepID=A0A2W5A4D8_9SPHN|nr:MAG: hypothetical protein DI623_10345 [Sphingomonas sanxanigenens]